MPNALLVPLHLDALFLVRDQLVTSSKADFTRLPYLRNGQDHHPDAPFLSEQILSQPFHNENLPLKAGLHLHWALPDAITQTLGGSDQFPAAPNRWLVCRFRAGRKEKAWIVESDYLYPAGVGKLSGSISYPYPKTTPNDPPFRFLGRNMPLAAWKNAPKTAEYLDKLTAVGYGESTFAAFYPNCHSVFGFHDGEITRDQLEGIAYEVTGWYTKPAQDFLQQLKAYLASANEPPTTLFDLHEALEEASNWRLDLQIDKQSFLASDRGANTLWDDWIAQKWLELIDEQTARIVPQSQWKNTPDERTLSFMNRLLSPYLELQTLCFSRLDFPDELAEDIENSAFQRTDTSITIAHTGTEALSAYLSHQLSGNFKPNEIEDQLEAIQLTSKLAHRQLDISRKFEEARHEKSFNAVNAGTAWVIRPQTDPHSSTQADNVAAQQPIALPEALGTFLNRLNLLQGRYDKATSGIQDLKRELFSDYYQYLKCVYPSDAEELIHPDEVKYYIEQKDLPQLAEKQRSTGKLSWEEDAAKRITQASAVEGGPNCLAQQLASAINLLIEELKAFNREGGLLLALKLGQKAADGSTKDDSGHEKAGQLVGNVVIVDDNKFHRVAEFDGEDAYLRLPALQQVKAISCWAYIPTSSSGCLIDAASDLLFSNQSTASGWDMLYINAQKSAEINWNALPKDQWVHLYLVFKQPFDGVIHFMSRSNQTEFLAARLAHIHVYNYALTEQEIQRDLNQFIRQQYVLQTSLAPRYWQAKEPVVLMSGKAVEASTRHGFDGQHRSDGKLQCVSWPKTSINDLIQSDFQQLPPKLQALKAQYPDEHFAFDRWNRQPWNPLMLEWQVIMAPLANKSNANEALRRYSADFITSNYQMGENEADLKVKPGKFAIKNLAYEYSGSSILTPYANIQLRDKLKQYLTQQLAQAYEQAKSAGQLSPSDTDLTSISQYIDWYKRNRCSSNSQDPLCSLIAAYELLMSGSVQALSQALGGLNDALLMHQLVMQTPLEDPIGFTEYQAFTQTIAEALGTDIRSAPKPDNDFNPIRSGVMRINQLRLIDSFGRSKGLYSGTLLKSQRMIVPGRADMVHLKPRIVQPARLNFRWLSAQQGEEEMNEHPATHPICGWLLANHLDHSIMVYSHTGQSLCSISPGDDPAFILRPPPGPKAGTAFDLSEITNKHLRKALGYLLERQQNNSDFLQNFITLIDTSLANIDPENYAQHSDLAMLMSRPIALVRASLDLELQGLPALNHDWNVLRHDLLRNTRQTEGFTQIDFPIRLGAYKQLNDGLVGYWLETSDGYKDNQFFAPQSDEVADEYLITRSESEFTLCQSLSAAPQMLSILLDPRGQVHATSGILPTKAINIPPNQYADALKQIEITFLSSPLLSDSQQVQLPLPSESGYQWSWLAKTNGGWDELSVPGIVRKTAFVQAFPDQSEAIWALLSQASIQWIKTLDDTRAEVIAVDKRAAKQLGDPWEQQRPQIEEILTQARLGPASLQADLHGTNVIREGWLKLNEEL